MKCQLCGKELKQINGSHLKKHNITAEEYKRMFPGSILIPISNKHRESARQGRILWNKSEEGNNSRIKRNKSEHMKTKISNALKNKPKSEEHKQKLKEAKALEDKNLRSIINGNNRRGKKHSKETIRKISLNSNVKHPYGFKAGIREDIGHYVRSTWEANYARILKFNNIAYEFEPEIIWLKREDGSNISYRPDFKIKDTYIEVKGYWYKDALEKMELFKQQYPNTKLVIIDSKQYKKLESYYKNKIKKWE